MQDASGDMRMLDTRLDTERLVLRVPQLQDFPRYLELFTHPTAARHIGGPMPRHVVWRKFLEMPGAWMLQGFAMFSVVEKSSGMWVGHAGPWRPDGWPGTEIGYGFHYDAWGKGYATEACTAAMDWAFDHLGWSEVIHSISPDNLASQSVAMRLGSRRRGPGQLPPPLDMHDIEIWGQTREEWLARREAARA